MMKKIRLVPLLSGLFLLIVFLAACSSNNTMASSTSGAATKTAVTTPTARSSATTASVARTPTVTTGAGTTTGSCNAAYGCGAGSSSLKPYQGSGYTIDYPGSWVIKSDGSEGNIFSMPDGAASLHVFVQSSVNGMNPLQYEFGTLAQANCKAAGSALQTVQINGQAWQQSQFVCTPADNGQGGGQVEQIGVLVSTSLHNGKYYSMDYMASPTTFNNVEQIFFKPMIASFKLA